MSKKKPFSQRSELDFSNGYNSKNTPPSSDYYSHDSGRHTPTRAHLAAYDNHGYGGFSNPAYASQPPSNRSYENQYPNHHSHHHQKMASEKKSSRYVVPTIESSGSNSSEGDSRDSASRRRQCLKYKIGLAVLVLVVFVAVAVGVAVYFSARQMSDNRDEETTAQTTAAPPEPAPAVEVSLKLTNKVFSPDLEDPTSDVYQNTKVEMEAFMDATMLSSNWSDVYNYTNVTGFQNGSLVVLYIIVFTKTEFPPHATPKPGETALAEKMEQLIKRPEILMEEINEKAEEVAKSDRFNFTVDTTFTVVAVLIRTPTTATTATTTTAPPSTAPTTTTTTTAAATTMMTSQVGVDSTTASAAPATSSEAPTTASTSLSEAPTSPPEASTTTSEAPTSPPEASTTSEATSASTEATSASTEATSASTEATTASTEATSASTEATSAFTEATSASTEATSASSTVEVTPESTASSSEATTTSSVAMTSSPETMTSSSEAMTSSSEGMTTSSEASATSPAPTTGESNLTSSTTSPPMTSPSTGATPESNATTGTTQEAAVSSSSPPPPTTTAAVSPWDTSATDSSSTISTGSSTGQRESSSSSSSSSSSTVGVSSVPTVPTTTATTTPSAAVNDSAADGNGTVPEFSATLTTDGEWEDDLYNSSSVAFQQLGESVESGMDMFMSMSDAGDVYNHSTLTGVYQGSVVVELDIFLKSRWALTNNASLLDVRDKLTASAMLSYFQQGVQRFQQQGNVPARHFSKAQIGRPDKDGCPKWPDVWKVMKSLCPTYDTLMQADNVKDACLYYARTVQCAAFMLRTYGRNCSVNQLHQRVHSNQAQGFIHQQKGNIDVRHQCPVSSLQLSVDLDTTSLCEIPEALVYIALFVPSDDDDSKDKDNDDGADDAQPEQSGSGMGNGAGQGTTSPSTPSATSTMGTTWGSTGGGDGGGSWQYLPSNPCTAAMKRSAHVQRTLQSLGLQCNAHNVSDLLSEQNFTVSSPALQEDVHRCLEYVSAVTKGDNKCFNLTDQYTLSPCYGHLYPFFQPYDIPDGQACSLVDDLAECLSRRSGCSPGESHRAIMDYFSNIVTLGELLPMPVGSLNVHNVRKIFACDATGGGGIGTTNTWPSTSYSPYSTPWQRPDLMKELRFKAKLTIDNLTWTTEMSDPTSSSFYWAARTIKEPFDAAFVNSDIGKLYAGSEVKSFCSGDGAVQVQVDIYLYTDLDPQYHETYQEISSNGTDFMFQRFHQGLLRVPPLQFNLLNITFLEPGDVVAGCACPEWKALWQMVGPFCSPSLRAFERATSMDAVCKEYIASLKCAAIMAKLRSLQCHVEELKVESLNDTFVFSDQTSGYNNAPFLCQDWPMDLIADLEDTPVCESPDAYLYIADYVCTGEQMASQSTHPNYPYYTSGYPSGSPSSYSPGYWTTSKTPSGSPSSYSPGYWTTSKTPSGSPSSYSPGYWTTSKTPSGSPSFYSSGYWTTSKTPSGSPSSYSPGYWTTSKTHSGSPSSYSTGYWTTSKTPSGSPSSYSSGYWTTSKTPSGSPSSYSPGYWTTSKTHSGSPSSYSTGYWTTSKTPSGSPSSYSSGYWTTSKTPSGSPNTYSSGYWTTSKTPSGSPNSYFTYYGTATTTYPWGTSTTHMPHYAETACSGFSRRAECIHQTLTSAGLSCPSDNFYMTLIRYNYTLLTEEAKRCEEESWEIVRDDCFWGDALSTCVNDIYMLFTSYVPDDVCSWWYERALVCVSGHVNSDKCPLHKVDRVWRRYLGLLRNLRHTTPVFYNLNVPLIDQVFACPADSGQHEKQGCPSIKELMQRGASRCFPIFASLYSGNSSLYINVAFSDTALTPRTLQDRCHLYHDLLLCLSLTLKDDYECDSHDLHETMGENAEMVHSALQFYPYQCKDSVPDKYAGPEDVCKSAELHAMLMKRFCGPRSMSTGDRGNDTKCLDFFAGVTCLSRIATNFSQKTTCSGRDVLSVLKNSSLPTINDYAQNFSSCFNQTTLLTRHGEVLLWDGAEMGTVCADGWDEADALVVCRQQGYQYGRSFTRTANDGYIDEIGPIKSAQISHIQCVGNETSLWDCPHSEGTSCFLRHDVAAVACSNVELRYELVPEVPGATYGYVNMTRDEGSGLVCSPYRYPAVAASLCRAAGYPNGGTVYPFSLGPAPSASAPAQVWRTYLECYNTNVDVENCASVPWDFGPANPDNASDGHLLRFPCHGPQGYLVMVFCFDKPVKLHTGFSNSSGIAQIFQKGEKDDVYQAYPFCRFEDNFTAGLFCKELGFDQGGVQWPVDPYNYHNQGTYYHAVCSGNEANFTDCKIFQGYTYCPDRAAVRCVHEPEAGVSDLDVRVRGGFDQLVLVHYQGEWGTICADTWTNTEANAVCRSAGYEGGFASKKDRGGFLPHLIHSVACEGNDTGLHQCRYEQLNSSQCHYTDAAAVHCYNRQDLASYRIAGGAKNNSGLVYVTYNNTEGLLCAWQVNYHVLCRSLGFVSGQRHFAETDIPDVDTVWTTSFNCPDAASSLENCRQEPWRKQFTFIHAGNETVNGTWGRPRPVCYETGFANAFCYSSSVKLNSGLENKTGVLQLYLDDEEGFRYVCREGLSNGALDELCRQATGVTEAVAKPLPTELFLGLASDYQGGVLLNSSCLESGRDARACVVKRTFCGVDQLSSVLCYPAGANMSGDITRWRWDRSSGLVMAEKYGSFGTVCRDKFNDATAGLFCRSQGYLGGYQVYEYLPMNGQIPMWVHSLQCSGNASRFSECAVVPAQATNSTRCFTAAATQVHCYSREEYVQLYLADLHHTDSTVTGRVMAYKDNRTGYLCSSKVSDAFADAACRAMGYENGRFSVKDASMLPDPDWSGQGWSAYWTCPWGEENMVKCLKGWSPEQLLYHFETDGIPRKERSFCGNHLVNVTCGTGDSHMTTPPPTTPPPPSDLRPCPDWYTVGQNVMSPCMSSLDDARYSQNGRCGHYAQFLKCASFVMRSLYYRCSEHELQQMALSHHWYFNSGGPTTPSMNYYGSSWAGSGHDGSGSSSGYYGSGYGSSSGDYGSGSGSSSDDYGSGSGSSSGHYGSGSGSLSGHYSSGSGSSSGLYGSGSGSSSGDYGSGSGSSSGDYGSGSGSSSGDYGSGSSAGDYGSGSSAGDYGSGSSAGDYGSGSGSSSGYYGSGSSAGDYGSANSAIYSSYSDWTYGGSSSGYGVPTTPTTPHSSSHSGGYENSYDTSLPVICQREYMAPSLVDMEKTEPCVNPDIILYMLKYLCRDTYYPSTYSPFPGHSQSDFTGGTWYTGGTDSTGGSDTWYTDGSTTDSTGGSGTWYTDGSTTDSTGGSDTSYTGGTDSTGGSVSGSTGGSGTWYTDGSTTDSTGGSDTSYTGEAGTDSTGGSDTWYTGSTDSTGGSATWYTGSTDSNGGSDTSYTGEAGTDSTGGSDTSYTGSTDSTGGSDTWYTGSTDSTGGSDTWFTGSTDSTGGSDTWYTGSTDSTGGSDTWFTGSTDSTGGSDTWYTGSTDSTGGSDMSYTDSTDSTGGSDTWYTGSTDSTGGSDTWYTGSTDSTGGSDTWFTGSTDSTGGSDTWYTGSTDSTGGSDMSYTDSTDSTGGSDTWFTGSTDSTGGSDTWYTGSTDSTGGSDTWYTGSTDSTGGSDTWYTGSTDSTGGSDTWYTGSTDSTGGSDTWYTGSTDSTGGSDTWYTGGSTTDSTGGSDSWSTGGYYTSWPYYTSRPSAPENACRSLSQKGQCISQQYSRLGLTCPLYRIYGTLQSNSDAILAEVKQCFDFVADLKQDVCFYAMITDTPPTCLGLFHDVPVYEHPCSRFESAVSCGLQQYPDKCRRENTGGVLYRWLSAETVLKNWSISLNIDVNDNDRENLLRCPHYQAKTGCPSFQELMSTLNVAFGIIFTNTNFTNNSTTLEEFCGLYEDVLAAAMLRTADYKNCSVEDVYQVFLNNSTAVEHITGFAVSQCADQMTFPQIDKNEEDLCMNSYFIRFVAYPCRQYNLSTAVDSTSVPRRVLNALQCYYSYARYLLPPSVHCSRESIIRGLKAHPQYLNSSYERYLDAEVSLHYDNSVLVRVNGTWSKVCGSDWDDSDAQVACRSMGYNIGYSLQSYQNVMSSGDAFGRLAEDQLTSVRCSGQESSLLDCPHERTLYCSDREARAICYMSAPVYELVSDKPGSPYGYVKRTVDGLSAFVTAPWVDRRAAGLLCQAANFSQGGVAFSYPLSGVQLGPHRWDTYFSCDSMTTRIEECAVHTGWRYESLLMAQEHDNGSVSSHMDPGRVDATVKVFCFSGTVRLHNSLFNSTGMAQVVKKDGKPGDQEYVGVCREGFTNFTASLFCRALGLGFTSGVTLGYQPFRLYMNPYIYFNVSCEGTETQLDQCPNSTVSGSAYCSSGFVAVSCSPRLYTSAETVPDMTVKLDHDNRTVLVRKKDEWGYICNDHWTNAEAEKVCAHLGFTAGITRDVFLDITFLPFVMHNVTCEGEAAGWETCGFDGFQDVRFDVCAGLSPAGVLCYNQSDLPVYSLFNGKDNMPHFGWVHVTREQAEGQLCANFNPEDFYLLLCRQLGFVDGQEYQGGDLPGQPGLPFWSTDFSSCSAKSPILEACRSGEWRRGDAVMSASSSSHSGNDTSQTVISFECYSGYHAKAFCYGQQARVHSGFFNTSGVLEVSYGGSYRHVCAQRDTYTQQAADVVCRNLTHSLNASAVMARRSVFMFRAKPRVHVNFTCQGDETELDQCMTVLGADDDIDCDYNEEMVAVVCYTGQRPTDGISAWKIGPDDSVLVQRLGLWGHVCSEDWTDREAEAFCKTRGYYSGAAIFSEAWGFQLAQWVSNMTCPPGSVNVSECSVTLRDYKVSQGQLRESCHARRAKCFNQTEVPSLFFADYENLDSSSSRPQGRVAVTFNNTKAYFCSYTVTIPEAFSTMCRVMGYPRGGEELSAASLSSLPAPGTYSQGWDASLRCGQWDRNAHPSICLKDWALKDVFEVAYNSQGGVYSDNLSWCGENIPALSCFDESVNYRLVSANTTSTTTQGMLVVWDEENAKWESVCRTNFNHTEAQAACRQLGFSEGGQLTSKGDEPKLYYNMGDMQFQCYGAAGETLSTCSKSTFTSYCSMSEAVWLRCRNAEY